MDKNSIMILEHKPLSPSGQPCAQILTLCPEGNPVPWGNPVLWGVPCVLGVSCALGVPCALRVCTHLESLKVSDDHGSRTGSDVEAEDGPELSVKGLDAGQEVVGSEDGDVAQDR